MNNSLEEENPFKGSVFTPEQTETWRELLSWQTLLISEDDLRALGKLSDTSARFEDGSGYLGQLDVYHELHCLNYIREYIHRDYYPNGETIETQVMHIDHCTDTLRQITMCHADISIVTFDWVDHHWQPYPDFAIERECRNWDSIFEYAKSHQPDMHNGSFFHPKYGPVPWNGPRHPGPRRNHV
ncbi:MAG: hypothetical protein MMC23_006039 [Stictis urceolatum]|nr:hypothetical protein [Stictis urceolata]